MECSTALKETPPVRVIEEHALQPSPERSWRYLSLLSVPVHSFYKPFRSINIDPTAVLHYSLFYCRYHLYNNKTEASYLARDLTSQKS